MYEGLTFPRLPIIVTHWEGDKMNINEKTTMLLSQSGFKPNECRVYLGMLQSGFKTPAKIARFCELPRQKIYRVLEDLVSKGACTILEGQRRKYTVVNPGVLIGKAQQRMRNLLTDSEDLAIELNELFEKANRNETAQDNVTILVDPVRVAELLADLMENVENEVLSYSTETKIMPFLDKLDSEKALEVSKRFRAGMERAVTEKAVSFLNLTSKQNINRSIIIYKEMEHKEQENVQVRLLDNIPCRLQIYDRETVILGIKNDISHQYTLKTLCIRDKGLASLLSSGFHAVFDKAQAIENGGIKELLDECRVEYEKWKKKGVSNEN